MNANCGRVSPECPVSLTIYGDYFTLGATATYAAIFGLMLVVQTAFAWKSKLWSFGAWLFCGTAFEFIGYVARSVMVDNPWNSEAFIAQSLTLVLGPTLVAAAISLTFKHLVLWHGPEYSLLKPRLYPVVFVGTDFISIVIQGAGGAIAAGADEMDMQNLGNNLLLAGVSFQVVNMVFCGFLILSYVWRRRNARTEGPMQMASEWSDGRLDVPICYQGPWDQVEQRRKKVKIFIIALAAAYIAIIARCIYRIPEMALGWGSSLMQNEAMFMTFDGALLMIACGSLTIFHPTYWFPFMRKKKDAGFKGDSELEMSSSDGLRRPEASAQES